LPIRKKRILGTKDLFRAAGGGTRMEKIYLGKKGDEQLGKQTNNGELVIKKQNH